MALENYCASCTYMSTSANGSKYWCEKKSEYRLACDAKCYSYCEAYSRSDSCRKNMFEVSCQSGGCYLTTAMCGILGYEDDNYYLNELRKFRDSVMKRNIKYIPLLYAYDTVGPMIAYELERDSHSEEIAEALFSNYITKAVGAIDEGKNQVAVDIYVSMTEMLADRYNINLSIVSPNMSKIDINTLGHGRVRRREKESTEQ